MLSLSTGRGPAVARSFCASSKSSIMGTEVAGPVRAVELFFYDAFPCRLAGSGRSGHAKYQRVVGRSGKRVGLQCGRADFQIGQMPEKLAKTRDDHVEQRSDGGPCGFLMGKARAAIGHNDLNVLVGDPVADYFSDLVQVARAKRARHAFMAFGRNACAQVIARRVVGRCARRSEEHTSELQSLMRISYAVFSLTKK